ncbi:hypothetical protein IKG45_02265 [Candidatus Saccharibacteria bacterium]|nr:hypothetical protein [Candidatus Saccharibacteria bacterium]
MKNLFLVIGLILGPVVIPFSALTLVEYVRFRKNPNRFYDAIGEDEDEDEEDEIEHYDFPDGSHLEINRSRGEYNVTGGDEGEYVCGCTYGGEKK